MRRIMMSKTKFLKGNNNLKRKNKRLNEKCKSLKESIVKLKKVISVGEDQFHDLCIKAEAADLFSRIMKRKKKTKQLRISYSSALRKFDLTLNFYSPTGYKYVRKVFEDSLPHPRTLGKWYENLNATPGFTAEAFDI